MKRAFLVVALLIAALVAVMVVRATRLPPPHLAGLAAPASDIDAAKAAQHLAEAVRIPTVSFGERGQNDLSRFNDLAELLRRQFPLVHEKLQRENVGPSLLYVWKGSEPKVSPALFLAHMDVVPVEPGTENKWTHAPFSGDVSGGFVWGRGTLDDKGSLIAQLEAAEYLLGKGYQPRRTLVFAFGHDEEIGGREGARKIAELLKQRGMTFDFGLDEGGAITEGVVAAVRPPVATVMTAEKGYVSFELISHDTGGHSSRPSRQTAIGRLARAVARVQETPMPAHLRAPTRDMLLRLAPEMPFKERLGISNLWLLESQVIDGLARTPTTDALIRTTTAPTMLRAGIKDNVLPSEARAVINFRILPGDSVEGVKEHIREVIDDPQIDIQLHGEFGDEPSPVSDPDSESFRMIERVVGERYPEAVISVGLVIGATDLRNYAGLFQRRYNFTPFRIHPDDLERIHGSDERIAVDDYVRGIGFYARLFEEAGR